MYYVDLKEKAAKEGVILSVQDYRFAYFTMMGETRSESYTLAVNRVKDPEKKEPQVKRGRPSKKPQHQQASYETNKGSVYYKREGVQWCLKELAILFPEKIRKYKEINFSAEAMAEKMADNEKKFIENNDKLSIDEIESFLTDIIRDTKNDTELPLKEKLSIIQFIKVYVDKLRPIDTSQDDVDRVLVSCLEPSNVVCPHCQREYYLDVTNDAIVDTFKRKLCVDCEYKNKE